MEKRKGSGLTGAMEGKGFYMVLFLCAAVIAAAVWLMIAGNDAEEPALEERTVDISDAVVTMLPAGTLMEEDAVAASAMQEDEPALTEDEPAETAVTTGRRPARRSCPTSGPCREVSRRPAPWRRSYMTPPWRTGGPIRGLTSPAPPGTRYSPRRTVPW